MRWAHSFAKFLPAEPEPRFSVRAFLLPGEIAAAEVCDSIAGIRACVAPSKGAELSSFQIKDAAGDWLELLHHGNDYTSPLGPGGWQGRSPNLFPAVGRNFTADQIASTECGVAPSVCRYLWHGKHYDLGVHGFLKDTDSWELMDMRTDDDSGTIEVTLDSATLSDAVKASYPFPFTMCVVYELRDGQLNVSFRVKGGEGLEECGMPFSIGNHITLKFPFTPAGSWECGRLHGTATDQYGLTKFSLLDGMTTPRPEFTSPDGLSLTDPSSCNMVSGGSDGDECFLELEQPGVLSVRVSQPPVTPASLNAHRYFVMWGDADGKFFCPEPWLGAPNSLNTHEGVVVLKAGESFEWKYCVKATLLSAS